jgi:hypothetical protein
LIQEFSRENVSEVIFRLAALPSESLDVVLLRRGLNPESIRETRAVLAENGTPFSAAEMVKDTFRPKAGYPSPFPIHRYGDGHAPVYYATLEDDTSIAEVRHHLGDSLLPPRYFAVVSCLFTGAVLILCGYENKYPDLTSATESGYPFCQKLANQARAIVEGLHAPSARQRSGICVPAFQERSLSNPQTAYRGRFVSGSNGSVRFERV